MISIDEHPPSDPSSSHDLKSSDNTDLKSSDASADLDDTYNPLSNISIRDYVFGLRNKDIAGNWPFSPTSLQLCLKHGVKNLLPPFESLDSLRNSTPLTRCSLGNRSTEDEIINKLDGKLMNDQIRAASLNSSGSKKDQESQFRYQETLARTRSKEKPSQKIQSTSRDKKSGHIMKLKLKSAVERVEKSEFHHQEYLCHTKSKEKPLQKNENVSSRTKKSRFVMKLNSGVEGVEEVVPNCLIVSETMASKVCPVCKIFSSSSNTTLNAHIDQCLTGEGTLKWTENPKILVKHKVKPRKMRSMVDIYKTAPHCTVEELDKRNGTSWATNSCFPAQEFQFQGEEKEEDDKEEEDEEVRTTKIISNVADHEGDVYIDTNGKKVRILSVPKTVLSDNNSARKLVKRVKGSKMIMAKKKSNIFKKKHQHKQLKISPNARKLCSSKPQAVNGPIAESCSEDERDKEIIRPSWAWSKRASLLKKSRGANQKVESFSGKNRKTDLQCRETKDLVVEIEKSSSGRDFKIRRSSSHNNSSSSQSRKKMRTSSPLIKQPLSEFRKEGTRIHLDEDEDDDDNDDFDDDYDTYDDDDAGPSQHSEGGDINPKGSKFASLGKNLSFPAAKFSLKRKFSAVENLNEDLDDRLSQDSSKDQSRMEEHAATRTNASKSSNEESSVGIRTVNKDEVCDVESIRNETLSNVDQVRVSSFMGLSMSFDLEFSKCIDLYQDQICSTNRAPNDVEQHENYIQEVDPIPIPGPPGSFLPASPCEEMGEMVSEEQLQATSVRSSEYQNLKDTMDQDSTSNSPVSTISNSRSTSVQDDTYKKPFFNGDTGFTDKGPSQNSLKNDQPCCCSRKEAALNYQESFNLRKQPIESSITTSRGLNFESEMFPLRNYANSPAPALAASPSKPVLRLMGKNLTVVKTDEDQDVSLSSQQFRTPPSSQQNPQRPVPFSQYQNGFDSQHFSAHPPINMRSHVDLGPINGGFMTCMNLYDRGGSYMGPKMPQARSHHGHDAIDFQAVSGRNVYNNVPSRSQPIKEIIVLDDSPEDEAGTMGNEFVKRNQEQMNPLYSKYPSQRSTHLYGSGGSTAFHGVGSQTFENGDPGRWNIGSSSASPSMSHMRSSTTYYPPSYP